MLGKRLKALRLSRGISQKELGKNINVTKASICCYEKETRTPSIENLKDLSAYFEVSIDYLIGNDAIVNVKQKHKKVSMTSNEVKLILLLRQSKNKRDIFKKMIGEEK